MVVGSNDSFLPSRRNGETVETTKGSWERASASSRVPLLFLRGNFFEQTDSRRSPCYEEWPATTSSSLLFFCRTRSPPFPSLYRFISYPQRLVQHFFHSQVEIIGFLFPPTRGLIPPPSFFSAPLPPLLPLVSITLLSLSLSDSTQPERVFFHGFSIENRRSIPPRVRYGDLFPRLGTSFSFGLSVRWPDREGTWTFIVRIRSCHADTHFLQEIYLSSNFDSELSALFRPVPARMESSRPHFAQVRGRYNVCKCKW